MKLSRFTIISLITVGVLLVGWIGLMMFTQNSSTRTGPAKVDSTVCPDCGTPLNKAGECPKCLAEQGVEGYRAKRAKVGFAYNPIIPIVLVSLFCLLLLTHLGIVLGKRARGQKTEVSYHVRCTKCGRKLRYYQKQIGNVGRCPLCQKPILFPRPAEAPKEKPWKRVLHYIWD